MNRILVLLEKGYHCRLNAKGKWKIYKPDNTLYGTTTSWYVLRLIEMGRIEQRGNEVFLKAE